MTESMQMTETGAAPSERLFRIDPPPVFPLFDIHVNAFAGGDRVVEGFYRVQSVEEATTNGTDSGNLAPPAAQDYAQLNAAVLQWTSRSDGRWRAMARCRGPRVPSPWTSMYRARRAVELRKAPAMPTLPDFDKYAAIKLMPHRDGIPAPEFFQAASQAGVPLLIHSGANCPPRWIEKHILPHVKSPVIFAHMGAWPCAMEMLIEAVEMARRYPNVYLETSGVWIGNFITYAAERVPEKILFGSNAPMCEPAVQWGHVAASVREDRVLEDIAYKTAERVFGPRMEKIV